VSISRYAATCQWSIPLDSRNALIFSPSVFIVQILICQVVSNLRKLFVLMSLCCRLIIHSLGALAKNGSFGFLAFGCVSAKTKCAICAVGCPYNEA
jgi:hypothetical protein